LPGAPKPVPYDVHRYLLVNHRLAGMQGYVGFTSQKSDWKRITLLRKTSFEKEI
jgi:hypothetical protein